MNFNKTKYLLIIVLFSSPIIIFLIKFLNRSISDNFSDWMDFGGVYLNLISLIVLGILTYVVSMQSNRANKKLNLDLKRIESYLEITAFLPKTMNCVHDLIRILDKPDFRYILSQENLRFKLSDDLEIKIYTLQEFYHYLSHFPTRYGFLYNYDFDKNDYSELLIAIKKIIVYLQAITDDLKETLDTPLKELEKPNVNFINLLHEFIDRLKLEISVN